MSIFSFASAYTDIIEDIAGNANGVSVTGTQLNNLTGISNALHIQYADALARATYTDRTAPTIDELQHVIDTVTASLLMPIYGILLGGTAPTVNNIDITPPVLILNGDSTITLNKNSVYTELGATAQDTVDGNIVVSISGIVDTSIIGNYNLIYSATDNNGNTVSITRNIIISEPFENLMHVKADSNISKKIKILGMGSGGSHHLLFHHSDGLTVIENGDMGAMSISHDGGKTFQQLTSSVHAKDISTANAYSLPRLFSIIEHPVNPDWLMGVATSGIISFSTDRGNTWHSRNILGGTLITNKIVIRQEGAKTIAYFAAGYKLGTTLSKFTKLGVWVDITDISSNISTFARGTQYNFIRWSAISTAFYNTTGYQKKYYYGDIARLGTINDNKLFVAGRGGLFVCEGDPKIDTNWKNITDSIFTYKNKVFPLDTAVSIGNKLYVLAFGDNSDTNGTAGVYVHTRNDINASTGKYNFTRIYQGLDLEKFKYKTNPKTPKTIEDSNFKRISGLLLKHKDTSDLKTYLYLIMQDVVYRLDVGNNSHVFKQITGTAIVSGKTYSKGFILGQRNTLHWSHQDNGSYTSFDKSQEFGAMTFGTSYFPSFSGINTAYSFKGRIYVSNTIEIKVSADNGKTFNSYTSKVSNSGSIYDGKIKSYYGNIKIYENNASVDRNSIAITPTSDATSFWWSGIKNIGMDNMVSTDLAINPNNPNEMIQTYMDSASFFSDNAGNSWHYIAGLNGVLKDAYWTLWIKGDFYAQDHEGIYRFNKTNLEFEKLIIPYLNVTNNFMYIEENIRVRRYYDKKSDTLVLAGYEQGIYNTIWVIKHFTNASLREFHEIRDNRSNIQFNSGAGIGRSFKDLFCDSQYIYAINSELGIIKINLNNPLPTYYNNYTSGLDTNEYVYSGLFDKNGSALLVTAMINKSTGISAADPQGEIYYSKQYNNFRYHKPFKLKKVDIATDTNMTIIPRGNGLTIDGKSAVASGNSMLILLGIDPRNTDRILASITGTQTTIESTDSGLTWKEFIPQISGNSHGNQAGNAVFAPSNSLYDVIIFGNGSTYGVLK